MATMLGIDTSHWKGDIVNTNVAIDFVYTKATEGTYYVDDACDPIVQWAIRRGKKWGVYHFATNLLTDPIKEADYFVDNCLGYIGKGILMLDYEDYWNAAHTVRYNNPFNVAWAKQWLDRVYARTGVKPVIYMSASVVSGADWSPVINADYGLWVAAYPWNNTPVANYQMNFDLDPNPRWGAVGNIGWQFTSTGRLNGYNANLDCDIFYGSAATWDAYAGVKPAPVPPPPPQPVITTKTITTTTAIPFNKISKMDDTLPQGQTKIEQEGVEGVRTQTYLVTYSDGVETKRELQSDSVTKSPVDEITGIGTKVPDPTPTPPPQPDPPPTPDPVPTPTPTPSGKEAWWVTFIKALTALLAAAFLGATVLRDKRTVVRDKRYDRIKSFDPRSRNYDIKELVADKPLRKRHWTVKRVLDQGNDGACVGFGWAGELIATPAVNLVDNKYAQTVIYWGAQKIDEFPGGEYPGANPGGQQGSSVLAGAKTVKSLGYIGEYRWAFNFQDVLKTLSNVGPVVVGTNWYYDMENVDQDGFIHIGGGIAGGHCYVLVGHDPAEKSVTIQNSWGENWGKKGQAKISYADLQRLLNEDGEACIPLHRKVIV